MYPHHHHHHHHNGGMGTGMEIQGQREMMYGQQERQLGAMEMNQGRM